MARRLLFPGIFLGLVLFVYIQCFFVYGPPFFHFLTESYAPGQAIRAALFWVSTHLLIPMAGGLLGAFLAERFGGMMKK